MVFALLLALLSTCLSCGQKMMTEDDYKIDSLIDRNYEFLKAQLARRSSREFLEMNIDSLQVYFKKEDDAIKLFESLTGIEARIVHNYALGKDYDEELLTKWKEWLDNNRERLRWDRRTSTVIRVNE